MLSRRSYLFAVLCLGLSVIPAAAQSLGTFRWQLQPYCNVFTLNVTQQGSIYLLDGTDDRCGGGNQPASASGIAYLTPLGLVGFGITSVLPGGSYVHTEATISIASLGGTWRDSSGNNGTFFFTTGTPVPGAQRPVISQTVRSSFAGGDNQFLVLPASPSAVVRSVTVNAPAAGKVLVNASAFFEFQSAGFDDARCEITTSATTINNNNAVYASEATAATTAMLYVPFGTVRGFDVPAGPTTFNLLCDRVVGSVGLWRSFMTALYTPQ